MCIAHATNWVFDFSSPFFFFLVSAFVFAEIYVIHDPMHSSVDVVHGEYEHIFSKNRMNKMHWSAAMQRKNTHTAWNEIELEPRHDDRYETVLQEEKTTDHRKTHAIQNHIEYRRDDSQTNTSIYLYTCSTSSSAHRIAYLSVRVSDIIYSHCEYVCVCCTMPSPWCAYRMCRPPNRETEGEGLFTRPLRVRLSKLRKIQNINCDLTAKKMIVISVCEQTRRMTSYTLLTKNGVLSAKKQIKSNSVNTCM